MNIYELIDKYFEGESTSAEEQEIRRFFAEETLPEELKKYKMFFAYFDQEIAKNQHGKPGIHLSRPKRKLGYYIPAIAACVLLLIGVGIFRNHRQKPCNASGNYAIVNGRCYSDAQIVKSMAFEALHEVIIPVREYFPEQGEMLTDKEIITTQLKELGSMFTE
jgi:hypothetical protein